MSIVENIRALCQKANITFAFLERQLNLGNGTIRKWDKNTPSVDKLCKVADFFSVTVDYLLGRRKNDTMCDSCYIAGLSNEDKQELMNYAQFLRNKKAK